MLNCGVSGCQSLAQLSHLQITAVPAADTLTVPNVADALWEPYRPPQNRRAPTGGLLTL